VSTRLLVDWACSELGLDLAKSMEITVQTHVVERAVDVRGTLTLVLGVNHRITTPNGTIDIEVRHDHPRMVRT